jgi:hypothetical protein
MVVVATSTIREVNRQGRLLTLLNRRESSARRGLIVSGAWTTGKSTALKQLGRTHELMIRQRHPGQDRIPVVYVTTPPKGVAPQAGRGVRPVSRPTTDQATVQHHRHRRRGLPRADRGPLRPGPG